MVAPGVSYHVPQRGNNRQSIPILSRIALTFEVKCCKWPILADFSRLLFAPGFSRGGKKLKSGLARFSNKVLLRASVANATSRSDSKAPSGCSSVPYTPAEAG